MPITVAVVEDDAPLRQTLLELVNRSPGLRGVGGYGDAASALRALPARAPDVLLLDLQLGGRDGVELLRELRQRLPRLRVLVLSQFARDELVFAAIRAGADGYTLKSGGLAQIEAGIHAVHRGDPFYPPAIERKLADYLRETAPSADRPHELTGTETKLLLLAKKGMGYKQMAEQRRCAYNTVRKHFDNIRAKLKVGSRAEAVAKFFGL